MTQAQIANEIGCTEKTYRGWESNSNKAFPSGKDLIALSTILGASTDSILGLTEVKSRNMDVRALHDEIGLTERAAQEIVTLSANYQKRIFALSVLIEQEEFRSLLDDIEFCTRFGQWQTYFSQAIKNAGIIPDHNLSLLLTQDRKNNRLAAINNTQLLIGKIAERLINESEKEVADNG